jgi:hypothetical protein
MKLKAGNYYTAQEMADLEKTSAKTINQRLFRAQKKPVSKDALYDEEAYQAIKDPPGKGRPKKPEADAGKARASDTAKPAKKTARPKK